MKHADIEPTSDLEQAIQTPRGRSWDVSIDRAALAYFDFEMTGLDPARDRIVEVAIVRVEEGAIVDVLDSLVSPGIEMTAAAQAVHQINPDALTSAPSFDTLAPRIRAILADAVPIGHGTDLDAQFVARAIGEPTALRHRLDTLTLARRAVSAPSYSLPALTAKLGLPSRRWHRALEDAQAVRALFERIVTDFGATRARDLWQVRVGQRERVVVREDVSHALARFCASGSPCEITLRTPGHPATTLVARVERWKTPHAHLVAVDRNALRVVRADRILRIRPIDAP